MPSEFSFFPTTSHDRNNHRPQRTPDGRHFSLPPVGKHLPAFHADGGTPDVPQSHAVRRLSSKLTEFSHTHSDSDRTLSDTEVHLAAGYVSLNDFLIPLGLAGLVRHVVWVAPPWGLTALTNLTVEIVIGVPRQIGEEAHLTARELQEQQKIKQLGFNHDKLLFWVEEAPESLYANGRRAHGFGVDKIFAPEANGMIESDMREMFGLEDFAHLSVKSEKDLRKLSRRVVKLKISTVLLEDLPFMWQRWQRFYKLQALRWEEKGVDIGEYSAADADQELVEELLGGSAGEDGSDSSTSGAGGGTTPMGGDHDTPYQQPQYIIDVDFDAFAVHGPSAVYLEELFGGGGGAAAGPAAEDSVRKLRAHLKFLRDGMTDHLCDRKCWESGGSTAGSGLDLNGQIKFSPELEEAALEAAEKANKAGEPEHQQHRHLPFASLAHPDVGMWSG